jgi:chemotaxis signal transduction protein
MSGASKYVLFPLGQKRFALPAGKVAELAQPDRLQTFPHTTPLLSGVLVRRGHIIAVCDVAQLLIGPDGPPRRFYLIAALGAGKAREMVALPVSGECELTSASLKPPASGLPEYVVGLLALADETVEILDLDALMVSTTRFIASKVRSKSAASRAGGSRA